MAGRLELPGLQLAVALRVTVTDDGEFAVGLLRPDQTADEVPASTVDWRRATLHVEFLQPGVTFDGKPNEDARRCCGHVAARPAVAGMWRWRA
ncbi:MAG: hypothetical protein ACP5G2_06685 [Candidatus Bipolaricaulaceae bacterium]